MPKWDASGRGGAGQSVDSTRKGHRAMIRQASVWENMTRVLSKDSIRRVVVGVEPVKSSSKPTTDLSHVRLAKLNKTRRVEEVTIKATVLTGITAATERVSVKVEPILQRLSKVEVTSKKSISLLPGRDVGQE